MIEWILLGAQAGLSLLQAQESSHAIRKSVREGAFQARYQSLMEQYQIRRAAEIDARERQERFTESLAAQRAALGFAGVSGGKTAQLLKARSRVEYERAQLEATVSAQLATSAAAFKEQQQISSLRLGSEQAMKQAGIDLFGSLLKTGSKAYDLYSAKKV